MPIASGMAVKLNPPGSRIYFDFELNPQAPAMMFRAQPDGSNATNLYMNATAGGLLILLNYPLASNERVVSFHISHEDQ